MAKKEKITEFKEYHKNPRHITDERKQELEKNMQELGDLSGIVHDLNTGEIISGNQRSKIINIKECEIFEITNYPEPTAQGTVMVGFVLWQGQEFSYRAVRWNEAQREKANITANALTGYWSHEILNAEWGDIDLLKWGLPEGELKAIKKEENIKEEAHRKLNEKFIVPPFSVLDSRKGYWLERKRAWKALIQDHGESREGVLAKDSIMEQINQGTSLFDPVLAELALHWFGIKGGTAFNAFSGDSVFGYVASKYDIKFKGIELREEQVKINREIIKKAGLQAEYICDDGVNVAKHFKPKSQDLFFCCPPYYDLENYSDLKNDASNQASYSDFLKIMDKGFSAAYKALKDNRFAVLVVGDIRDKEGAYRLFVDDMRKMWVGYGAMLYNELIFVEPVGTLPQRVSRSMRNRKIGKCHQNILVFYKGDPKEIQNNFPEIVYDSEDMELFTVN